MATSARPCRRACRKGTELRRHALGKVGIPSNLECVPRVEDIVALGGPVRGSSLNWPGALGRWIEKFFPQCAPQTFEADFFPPSLITAGTVPERLEDVNPLKLFAWVGLRSRRDGFSTAVHETDKCVAFFYGSGDSFECLVMSHNRKLFIEYARHPGIEAAALLNANGTCIEFEVRVGPFERVFRKWVISDSTGTKEHFALQEAESRIEALIRGGVHYLWTTPSGFLDMRCSWPTIEDALARMDCSVFEFPAQWADAIGEVVFEHGPCPGEDVVVQRETDTTTTIAAIDESGELSFTVYHNSMLFMARTTLRIREPRFSTPQEFIRITDKPFLIMDADRIPWTLPATIASSPAFELFQRTFDSPDAFLAARRREPVIRDRDCGADLRPVLATDWAEAFTNTAPGFFKVCITDCEGGMGVCIVVLQPFPDTRIARPGVWAVSKKARGSKFRVEAIEVCDPEHPYRRIPLINTAGAPVQTARSDHCPSFTYDVGCVVEAELRRGDVNGCGSGIHFFDDRKDAVNFATDYICPSHSIAHARRATERFVAWSAETIDV